jgi:hypothetical protein
LLDQCRIGFKNFVIPLDLEFNSSTRLTLGNHEQQSPGIVYRNIIHAEQNVTSSDAGAPGRAVGGYITNLNATPHGTAIGLQ